MKTFEEVWAVMKSKGYEYGSDALEQVKFGWELGLEALKEARQDDLNELNRLSEEIGRIAKQSAANRARAVELETENKKLRQESEDFRTVTITRARLNELENMLKNAEKERDEYYSAGLRQAEELESLKGIISRFKERYNALPAMPNVQQWHGLATETISEIEGWAKDEEPSDTWHPDTLTPVQQRIVDAEQLLKNIASFSYTPVHVKEGIRIYFTKYGDSPKDQSDSSAKATEETTSSAKSAGGDGPGHINGILQPNRAGVLQALDLIPSSTLRSAKELLGKNGLGSLGVVLELELERRGENS